MVSWGGYHGELGIEVTMVSSGMAINYHKTIQVSNRNSVNTAHDQFPPTYACSTMALFGDMTHL